MNSKELSYTAVIQKEKDDSYTVSFPALPGCVTCGWSYDETLEMAQEVLELWIEELVESGESLPIEGQSSMTILKTPRPLVRKHSRSYASTRTQRA